MAKRNRKRQQRRGAQTHAEYVESNVHYLPQAQKQKQVQIQGRNPNQKQYIQKLLDDSQTIIFATVLRVQAKPCWLCWRLCGHLKNEQLNVL